MPISAAAVTEAKSSTERLRLWSPTTRVLQVVGDGVITLTSFFKPDCDIKVRKTSVKISAMSHNPTINTLLSKNDALAQASRVCLHGLDGVRATAVRVQRIVSIVPFRSVHTVHISISIFTDVFA